ncbi:MAG TPA: M48 family metalloprotease [Polyangiaceae bacterium]|nr:M48 family metalloprotease [Polyangiaceae bacterium]
MSPRVLGRPSRFVSCFVFALAALPGLGCKNSSQASYPTTVQQFPQQPQPAGAAPVATAPGVQPTSPAPAGQSAALPAPGVPVAPAVNDPINATDLTFLRGQAQSLLNELVATLPAPQQQRVAGIPLVVDSTVGDVNAFASCTSSGHAAMAITDGLLDIEAHLSQARATDEIFGTHKLNDYIQLIVQQQKPNRPIVQPPLGFFDPTQQVDGRKVLRQHQLLEEQIGFVLGHELAHHYLGHLPCTSAGQLPIAELGQVLSGSVPLFNQPNEIAADGSGTNTLLTMGFRRSGYHLTEGGALITMQFFAGLEQFSAGSLIFGFQNSHPPAVIRSPIIQQTAAAWRLTGGRGLPYLI